MADQNSPNSDHDPSVQQPDPAPESSRPQAETSTVDRRSEPIVVGLGASAGGLRALQRFFEHTERVDELAYVVVTHLSPEHESHLAMLLQPYTSMSVLQVTETIKIRSGHVYVIPPNRNLSAIDTHLRLEPLEQERRARAPIDHFFRTLAEAQDAQAIGIILSGTGTDGALGIQRIKEVGGLTICQDPLDAEYDSMPQSAIATGQVDLVLPVHEIPAKLTEFVRTTPSHIIQDEQFLDEDLRDSVQKILAQVRARTGHDFTRYKPSTIMRRIGRRMQIHGMENFGEYLALLRLREEETRALFHDFLITVTNFFRDPDAFQLLEQEVIPKLFQGKEEGDHVRVWVIGCATGEEAYSLAILLLEHIATLDRRPSLQIFASDLSESALQRGRDGFYPETIAADVTPERLQRFFVKEQGGYRVRKEVRELVLFAPHNVLKDPPFSRLDLITCRNLLIYLERSVQRQVFELFHYALRPNGFLFLGPSEVVEGTDLFNNVSKKFSIFQRQNVAGQDLRLPTMPLIASNRLDVAEPNLVEQIHPANYSVIYNRMMERYGPPSVLVNSDYNIVYYAKGVSRYLVQPPGEPTNHVLKRVRDELRGELTTLLYRTFETREACASVPVPLQLDGQMRRVTMNVWLAAESSMHGFVLVLFHESEERTSVERDDKQMADRDVLIQELDEELDLVKKRLQSTIEEFETSKEEMKAANEELQSMNEELRSTAEELETSKEELQSINEELITVNQENKNKVEELSQLTSDLQNLLASTDIATLFLDRELRITRFTPRVGELFNVLPTDRGRPLAHITHKLGYDALLDDAATVLRTLVPIEREVSSEIGRWYLMRLLPYRTVDDRIDGIVVTFVDITQITRTESERRRLSEQLTTHQAQLTQLTGERVLLDAIINQMPAGIMIAEAPSGQVILSNQRMRELRGDQLAAAHFTDWHFFDPEGQPLKAEEYPIARALHSGEAVHEERLQGERADGTRGPYTVNATPIRDQAGNIVAGVLIMREDDGSEPQA
jgi:two-component system CheB/CheR fusion protein